MSTKVRDLVFSLKKTTYREVAEIILKQINFRNRDVRKSIEQVLFDQKTQKFDNKYFCIRKSKNKILQEEFMML